MKNSGYSGIDGLIPEMENQEESNDEVIPYDGDNKSDEQEVTEESEEEIVPRKSERVWKRTAILTYGEIGGNPTWTWHLKKEKKK